MAITKRLLAIHVGESWEGWEPPYTVGGNGHWQESLERTL